ncbi:MAG: CpaE family protein [Tepidibacillus sp.]
MNKIHLVYPFDFEELKKAIEEELGYEVVDWDYSLAQFKAFSEGKKINAEIALINGATETDKHEIFNFLREIRINLPNVKLIVQFPESLKGDTEWVTKIVGLGIYNIHFLDEFDIDDVEKWLKTDLTLADYNHLFEKNKFENEEKIESKTTFVEEDNEVRKKKNKTKEKVKKNEKTKHKVSLRLPKVNLPSFSFKTLFGRKNNQQEIKREYQSINDSSINKEFYKEPAKSLDDIFGLSKPNHAQVVKKDEIIINPLKDNSTPETKIVGFFSGTKGSVGKTTLSGNTAAYLTTKGYKVALIDADEQSRGATVMAFQDDHMLPAKSSILGGVTVYSLSSINIDQLSKEFDYVILDFGNIITFQTISVLHKCDTLFLIAIPESLSVSIIRRFLEKEGKPLENRLHLVINRYAAGRGMEPWEVAKKMGLKVSFIVPDDLEHIEEANKKQKAVIFLKNNLISQSLEEGLNKLKIV